VAFPATPLPVKVELQLAGTWTDVTSYVLVRDRITIKRGRSSEAKDVDPSTCQLTLDNRDGRFSPRNPSGAYYGLIGRNTPLRVSVTGLDDNSLQTDGTANAYASTPNAAALNVTTDLDLRVEWLGLDQYRRSVDLMGKWDATGAQRSYLLWMNNSGYPFLSWWTGSAQIDTPATVPLPRDNNRRYAIRASLTASTGTVTFYWSDDFATWRQLGDPVVKGATTVASSTAPLRVGRSVSSGVTLSPEGRFYRAQVRTGAGATSLVANPDFTIQTAGSSSFADSTGKTWTVNAPAAIASTNVRFVGEVSQWPVKWEYGEDDVYVPITASGILRRLLANVPPLRSVLRRSVPGIGTQLRAYWPMEDEGGATALRYGLTDQTGRYDATTFGVPQLSTYSGFLASDPIPTWSGGSYATAKIPPYTSTGQVQLRFLLALPATGQPPNNTTLAEITMPITTWAINYTTGGNLQVVVTDSDSGAVVHTSAVMGTGLDGKQARISLELKQNGGAIDWSLGYFVPGSANAIYFNWPGALTTTVGQAGYVTVGCPAPANSSVSIGQVTVESTVTSMFDIVQQINAYAGESSVTRAYRLCLEEGVPFLYAGTTTTLMGAQSSETLIELLRETADSNVGILYEPRHALSLAFRPRVTMYARDAALVINYAGQQLTGFEPVEDDANVVNDVLLTRIGGSSYEASLDSGALSTLAPPNGIGKYQSALKLSLYLDTQLPDQASFRLSQGTLDEPRYPQIGIGLHRGHTLAFTRSALDADLGDIVEVDNTFSRYAPGTAFQRIEGVTEVLDSHTYDVTYNTSPGSIWRGIGVYDDPTGRTRYDSGGATLTSGITSTATIMSVTTTDTTWTTASGDWPFQVIAGGEVMTVVAVTGSSSPQTFTVTRSVNGVVKAQSAGTPVHVYTPSYYGL
jgi:hypothetical protein